MKASDLITLGVGAGVLYGLYKLFGKGGPAQTATNAVAGAIAAPIAAVSNFLEGSYNMQPSGNVILPDGTKINLAQAGNLNWDNAVNVLSFTYNGYGYIIPPNPTGGPAYDANGDYHAQ